MSTEKRNINRFSALSMLGEVVFHTKDLGVIWGISNQNTLNTTLSRYASRGFIYRVYNGLYSIKNPKDIDPYLLGTKALHGSAYVSCESILFDNGIINQPPREITLVGSVSKRFMVAGHQYHSRQLQDIFLFNNDGIEIKNGVRVASLSRAIADMLYFSPRKYMDSNRVDWAEVRAIAEKIGYTIKYQKYDECT